MDDSGVYACSSLASSGGNGASAAVSVVVTAGINAFYYRTPYIHAFIAS